MYGSTKLFSMFTRFENLAQSTAQHVATGCTGDVQECEEVWREWHRVLCEKCVEVEGDRQLMSFTLKMLS